MKMVKELLLWVLFIIELPLIIVGFFIFIYRYMQPRPNKWFTTTE